MIPQLPFELRKDVNLLWQGNHTLGFSSNSILSRIQLIPQCCKSSVYKMNVPASFWDGAQRATVLLYQQHCATGCVSARVQKAGRQAGRSSLFKIPQMHFICGIPETLCIQSCSHDLTISLPISVRDSHLSNWQLLMYCHFYGWLLCGSTSIIHSLHTVPV